MEGGENPRIIVILHIYSDMPFVCISRSGILKITLKLNNKMSAILDKLIYLFNEMAESTTVEKYIYTNTKIM